MKGKIKKNRQVKEGEECPKVGGVYIYTVYSYVYKIYIFEFNVYDRPDMMARANYS